MYAYIGVQVYTGMYRCKRVYTCIYTVYAYIGAQVCTGVLVCIYRCIQVYRYVQVYTGMHRCVQVFCCRLNISSLSHSSSSSRLSISLTATPYLSR